jgi:hypothetical protein
MVPAVSAAASTRYRTALLIDRSSPPILIEIQGSSLNSFCGWKASFFPAEPSAAYKPMNATRIAAPKP